LQNPAKPCKTQKRFNHFKILQYPFASVEFARERERKEERKFCFLFFFTAKLLQNRIFFRASPPPCAPPQTARAHLCFFPPVLQKFCKPPPFWKPHLIRSPECQKTKLEFCRVLQSFAELDRSFAQKFNISQKNVKKNLIKKAKFD